MQSDGIVKNVDYITIIFYYLSDVSGNPRKRTREVEKEIYADITVLAELLKTLPSKLFTSEAEVRLERSRLRIE
jgi:hypothetical protein